MNTWGCYELYIFKKSSFLSPWGPFTALTRAKSFRDLALA